MGFFSWRTQDTNQSIPNIFAVYNDEGHEVFTVYMTDDKGNQWREDEYEGYGVFGGKDFYVLLAEMNGLSLTGDLDKDRSLGISLSSSDKPHKSPNLTENPDYKYDWRGPQECEYQGYFYD
jgi:hypothetical protein